MPMPSSNAAALELWESSDPSQWKRYLDSYDSVLEAVAKKKAKEELVALDRWQFNGLRKAIQSRSNCHLTRDEISRLMKWKLSRGTFRPGLQNKADSNSEADCETATSAALAVARQAHDATHSGENLDGAEISSKSAKAIDILSKGPPKLKGIGPATASAILSAVFDSFPFMSDEALAAALQPRKSFRYTPKEYGEFCAAMRKKTSELSSEGCWSAGMIEHALWAASWQNQAPSAKSRKRKVLD